MHFYCFFGSKNVVAKIFDVYTVENMYFTRGRKRNCFITNFESGKWSLTSEGNQCHKVEHVVDIFHITTILVPYSDLLKEMTLVHIYSEWFRHKCKVEDEYSLVKSLPKESTKKQQHANSQNNPYGQWQGIKSFHKLETWTFLSMIKLNVYQ